MRYLRLSYDVSATMPLYPGTKPVTVESVRSIARGDSCNTLYLGMSNHAGTHIDAPRHFWDGGRSLSECGVEEFVFRRPTLLECPKGPEELILAGDLSSLKGSSETDLVVIRTGFGKYRSTGAQVYAGQNPCLAPDAAWWLKREFPSLRAVGIDCISVASPAHRELGRETHRILLGDDGGRALFIIEDLRLPYDMGMLQQVIVAPLFIENGDGAPCTVIGVFSD